MSGLRATASVSNDLPLVYQSTRTSECCVRSLGYLLLVMGSWREKSIWSIRRGIVAVGIWREKAGTVRVSLKTQSRPLTPSRNCGVGPFTPSASTSVYVRRRASTDVDARLRQYGTHVKRPARSHQARLRPSTDVNALKIERCPWSSRRCLYDVTEGWAAPNDVLARVFSSADIPSPRNLPVFSLQMANVPTAWLSSHGGPARQASRVGCDSGVHLCWFLCEGFSSQGRRCSSWQRHVKWLSILTWQTSTPSIR